MAKQPTLDVHYELRIIGKMEVLTGNIWLTPDATFLNLVGPLMVKYGFRFPLGHHLVLEEAHLSGKEMEKVIYMSNLDFSESKPVKILCVPRPIPLLPITDRTREIIGSALDAAAYRLSLLFEFPFDENVGPKLDDVFRALNGVNGVDYRSRTSHPATQDRPQCHWLYSRPADQWILPRAYSESSWELFRMFNDFVKKSSPYNPTRYEVIEVYQLINYYAELVEDLDD